MVLIQLLPLVFACLDLTVNGSSLLLGRFLINLDLFDCLIKIIDFFTLSQNTLFKLFHLILKIGFANLALLDLLFLEVALDLFDHNLLLRSAVNLLFLEILLLDLSLIDNFLEALDFNITC